MTQPPMPPPPPSPPPGTPPPPPPGDWATPARDFHIGDAISYGWTAYWQNVGPMLLLALVVVGVNLLIGALGSANDSVVGVIALQILNLVVGIIVGMGLIRASLAVCRGEQPRVDMLLQTQGFVPYFAASILVGIGTVVGFVLLIVPGIILAIMWHFFGYVIVENPDTSPVDAMRRSAEITRGYRWQIFGLGLLLVLINIGGALACGVGLIFTYGITSITVAYAYRTLSGQSVSFV
jgi:uncharacterized membrane protein